MTYAAPIGLSALCLGLVLALGGCDQATAPSPSPAPAPTPAVSPAPTPQADAQPVMTDCLTEIGAAGAKRLVERCIMVSPATHPPCNAANTCETIQGEIDRGCSFFDADEKPAECAA